MSDSREHPQTEPLTLDQAIQVKVAHLNMIQGVVSRVAGYSASIKNFCVTIVAAVLALYSQRPDEHLAWLALLVVVVFGLLDARYLCVERAFRSLYNSVRREPLSKGSDFYIGPTFEAAHKTREAVLSWSVLWFYLPFLAAIALLLVVLK